MTHEYKIIISINVYSWLCLYQKNGCPARAAAACLAKYYTAKERKIENITNNATMILQSHIDRIRIVRFGLIFTGIGWSGSLEKSRRLASINQMSFKGESVKFVAICIIVIVRFVFHLSRRSVIVKVKIAGIFWILDQRFPRSFHFSNIFGKIETVEKRVLFDFFSTSLRT